MKIRCKTREKSLKVCRMPTMFCRILELQGRRIARGRKLSFHNFQIHVQDSYDIGTVKDPGQPCGFCMCFAGVLDPMGLARALSGLIQADCGFRTARTTDRIRCFQACTSSARTSIVPVRAPYGTHR